MKALSQSQNSFEKNSFILFVLMMMTNVCNYLFQIITGRLLAVEEYALENTLLSLLTICSMPASILSLIAVNYTARANLDSNHFKMASVIRVLLRFVIAIAALLMIVAVFCAAYPGDFFGIEDTRYLIYIFALSILLLFYQVVSSIQQGMQRFSGMGIQGLLQASGKLLLGCGLIVVGWKVYGALTGILIGTFAAITYGIRPIWNDMKKAFMAEEVPDFRDTGFWEYALGAAMIQCGMVVFTNGDILLIKYYFSDTEAGIYSSAMVIGKIAMYVSSAVVATLFPMVIEMEAEGKDSRRILTKAFCYGGGACIACSAGMLLFGKLIIGILFGQRYLQSITYLPAVCFFVVPLTFVTILMNYSLALNIVRVFAGAMLIGLSGCIALTFFFHETVMCVMLICGSILWLVFLFNLVCMLAIKKKRDVEI